MYWTDYSIQKRRKRWLLFPTLLLGLLIGLALGGGINGWWDWTPATSDAQADTAVNTGDSTDTRIDTVAASSAPTTVVLSRRGPNAAPDFVLSDLFDDSLEHGLASYSGRPLILNFWASWCVPCRTEMPALQRAYEEHRDEGLVVLGVNQTFVDNVDAARDFVDELALTFPNVRDDDGITSEKLYQVMGLPTSVFITAEGEIAHTQIGQMTDEQIGTFSKRLLAGEAINP